MNEQEKYTTFLQVCQESLTDDQVFNNFKQNIAYTYMLEQHWETTEHIGSHIIHSLIKNFKPVLKTLPWDKYRENDSLGNPRIHNYTQLAEFVDNCYFTHTTLRYVLYSLYIWRMLKDKELNENFSVIEIGGGYGGQCKILFDTFSKLFPNLNIHYTLLDLKPVSEMQRKYLGKLGLKNVEFYTESNYPKNKKYDLCISEYCIGEIGLEYQFEYIENIVFKSRNIFFLWNHSPVNAYLAYKRELLIEDEDPLITEGNKMVTFK